MVVSDMEFAEPSLKIFFTELINVGVTVYFDVVFFLNDVDSIEHVKISLPLDRH